MLFERNKKKSGIVYPCVYTVRKEEARKIAANERESEVERDEDTERERE